MTRASVATPTTTTPSTKLMQTTSASVAAARNRKALINLRANSSGSGKSNNNNTNNQAIAGQSKYLTWYKIVSEHNNNNNNNDKDNYTNKSNNYNESYNSKSDIAAATATTRRNEQIGNVDGNAGGNGSVRVAHTGNANKSRIKKNENSYYSVNKFVLATNERRSVGRRHVNRSLVNSVNKNKNRHKSKNRSHASGHSFQVEAEIEKGKAFANITRLQFDRQRQFSVSYYNKSVSAGVVSASVKNISQNVIDNQEAAIFSGSFSSRAQISTHDKQQSLTINNSATIAATTTTTTESIRLDYIVITDYNRPRKRTFWQKYGE
nr:putative uncharacterized protein DDB_G0277255 [Bactrocera oleae]